MSFDPSNPLSLDFTPSQIGQPTANVPAAGPSGYMAGGMFLSMFSSIASSLMQANAIKLQGQYQQQQLNFNSQVADIQAQAALDEGEHQAEQIERQGQQTAASERAQAGASGVDVNSGSALVTQQSTQTMSALDALTARNNAARQAWGYKVQAANDQGEAAFAGIAAQGQANSTLLTGGLNAFSSGIKGAYYLKGGNPLTS